LIFLVSTGIFLLLEFNGLCNHDLVYLEKVEVGTIFRLDNDGTCPE